MKVGEERKIKLEEPFRITNYGDFITPLSTELEGPGRYDIDLNLTYSIEFADIANDPSVPELMGSFYVVCSVPYHPGSTHFWLVSTTNQSPPLKPDQQQGVSSFWIEAIRQKTPTQHTSQGPNQLHIKGVFDLEPQGSEPYSEQLAFDGGIQATNIRNALTIVFISGELNVVRTQ